MFLVVLLVVCLACCLVFLARATESWLGGFCCMSPVLVRFFLVVGWIRPDRATGAVFSLAAPVRVQFCLYLTFVFLATWLKALGTSRKKKELQTTSTPWPATLGRNTRKLRIKNNNPTKHAIFLFGVWGGDAFQ